MQPVRLEREHLSLSVAAMPDVSEGDLLGMLAFLCFYNRHNRAIGMEMTTRPDGVRWRAAQSRGNSAESLV